MNLTTVTGLKSEIYVPITPPAVFTPLTKPLAECVVALCTAGGVHLKSQPPFVLAGDHTFREIPATTPSSELMVSHGGFDNSDVNRDINAMLPLDRLRELAAEGCIGRIAPTLIGFMGGGGDVDRFRTETGPAIATIIIAALPPVARQQGAPRISAPHVPIGSNAGEPGNAPMQRAILKDTLRTVEEMTYFGQLKWLPYEYRRPG